MNDFVVVTLIFGNLMYSVHVDKTNNNNDVKALVGNTTQRYNSNAGSKGTVGRTMSMKHSIGTQLSMSPVAPPKKICCSCKSYESGRNAQGSDDVKHDDVLKGKDSWAGVNLSLWVAGEQSASQAAQ